MADLSQMSDAELRAIAGIQEQPQSAPAPTEQPPQADLSQMSDEDLMKIATGGELEETTLGQDVLQGVIDVGEFVDRYTGAPARAAIQEVKESLERPRGLLHAPGIPEAFPPLTKAIVRGGAKFAEQFGEDPAQAPTGKEIAAGMGASTEETIDLPVFGKVSPAGIAGLGVDVIADPTSIIPIAAPAKLLAKGSKATAKAALKGSAAASEFAARKVGLGTPLDVTRKIAESGKSAFNDIFKPKQAEDFPALLKIAEKNGIDQFGFPESIEFGPTSIISRGSKVQRENIGGEQALESFMNKLNEVQQATDNKISAIGGGQVLSPIDAGDLIRRDYDRAVSEFFDNIDVTYNSITKDFPNLHLTVDAMSDLDSKLAGLEKFAKGRVKRGVTQLQRGQGQGLLNSIAAIRESNGSFKQTVEVLRDVGDAAFKSENTLASVPADVARMRKLYGDISNALMDTTGELTRQGAKLDLTKKVNKNVVSMVKDNLRSKHFAEIEELDYEIQHFKDQVEMLSKNKKNKPESIALSKKALRIAIKKRKAFPDERHHLQNLMQQKQKEEVASTLAAK